MALASSALPREWGQSTAPLVIALQARISVNTPRDLRGVETLARLVEASDVTLVGIGDTKHAG